MPNSWFWNNGIETERTSQRKSASPASHSRPTDAVSISM